MSAVTVPPVFAGPGDPPCPDKHPGQHVPCNRPWGHDGGHLNRTGDIYWQQAELQAVSA